MLLDHLLELMTFFLFAGGVALFAFGASLYLLRLGRRFGKRYLADQGAHSLAGLNVVEGAVFALMGLLLAFSINGALQRFDERRLLIEQEATAIATAADRIDLMEASVRGRLRDKLAAYLEARLALFHGNIDFSLAQESAVYDDALLRRVRERRQELWQEAASQCPFGISNTGCALFLPALNSAFDAAMLRRGASERHPPQMIFVMLFSLALGASLLAGFSMAAAKSSSIMHALTFAAAISVTLYIITDIEFPRLGLIRVDYFDHFLVEALETIRQQQGAASP